MERIVECVPNFSEGRNPVVIESIANAVRGVEGVTLLDIDPGKGVNRTVMTFAGEPGPVAEAAFQSVKRASELIDMRYHSGEHPRIGATDVLPFVPVSGISLVECAEIARTLARRVYGELGIPVYCYQAAALKPGHKNLADCRKDGYESLRARIVNPDQMPDLGGGVFTCQAAKSGATVIGARNFLVAVNYNLDTDSSLIARRVASIVREKGRIKREGDIWTGTIVRNEHGAPLFVPGTLKGCKAIGWYIPEYGFSQVSMNITDVNATGLLDAFREVSRVASFFGAKVTGTEIIGLVPKKVIIDAGSEILFKGKDAKYLNEIEIIETAVNYLGLSRVSVFDYKRKILEFALKNS